MINIDNNFFKNFNNLLYIQSIEIIQQNLEDCDEWIFKNYKIDETLKKFKDYKVKEIKPRTLTILNGKITFKRRKYYKINPETGKEEYIFPLDKLLGIEKWQRINNSVKEKILSFIGKKKTYQDILDTMEHVKICIKTISNIMKNAKTDKEYYLNKTDKKIKIPHTLYIQIDGTYLKMWNEKKKGKEKIKKHSIFSTVHTGFDKVKSTKKRPVIQDKLGVIELDNIPEYIKKNSKLTNFVNKLLTLITSYYDVNDNIEFMVLGDGALWIKNIVKFIQEYFPKNKVHYTIDKFHLTNRFKKLYPYQSKNKENRETYHKAVDYFFNAKYEELLECLENSASFIKESKMKFLKETIKLIKNNTSVCYTQTVKFNKNMKDYTNARLITVSRDLPFAQERCCESFRDEAHFLVSDYNYRDFGTKTGLVFTALQVLPRAVLILNQDNIVEYLEIVNPIENEPNYQAIYDFLDSKK